MSIPGTPENPAAMTELLYRPLLSNRASSCATIPPAMTRVSLARWRNIDRSSPLRRISRRANKWMHLTRSARARNRGPCR